MANKYGLDNGNIGWYFVSYRQGLWEQLEVVKYYEVFYGLWVEIFEYEFYACL